MTNPDYTHITLVVDRSGSMNDVRDEAQGGIVALLKDQHALPGRLTVTLTQFDTEVDTPVRMSSEPFDYTLDPRGMTALLDAVGSEIMRTGEDLAALDENARPGRVLFVVVTDGDENASSGYSYERIHDMVAYQRDVYSWTFQFIGADEAAWQGERLGMDTTAHAATGAANRAVYASLSLAATNYRSGQVFSMPAEVEEDEDPAT